MVGAQSTMLTGSQSSGSREHASRPRLFLLSDVRLYRDGLVYSLERRNLFDIVGASDLSDHSVAEIAGLEPDAVVLDMGEPRGFEVAKRLAATLANLKIVAFAVRETEHLVLACAEAGIAGYVTPDCTEEDLANAVVHALRGELSCSPKIAGLLFKRIGALSARYHPDIDRGALTEREHQILKLLGEGMSNKEIGRALRISYATVKNHVHNILEKLQVRRRGEAAAQFRAQHSPEPRQAQRTSRELSSLD
jgi:two-component system, NarL family, nitrate/nitrite response regulator NarL